MTKSHDWLGLIEIQQILFLIHVPQQTVPRAVLTLVLIGNYSVIPNMEVQGSGCHPECEGPANFQVPVVYNSTISTFEVNATNTLVLQPPPERNYASLEELIQAVRKHAEKEGYAIARSFAAKRGAVP